MRQLSYFATLMYYSHPCRGMRPFEREFAGTQRIEPLSRAEEHAVLRPRPEIPHDAVKAFEAGTI